MRNDPSETREEVAWGKEKRPAHPARPSNTNITNLPNVRLNLIVAVIAILATLGVVFAAGRLHQAKPQPASRITVLAQGSPASFPVRYTSGADLEVQYLQASSGPKTIWLTLMTHGLPLGYDYTVTAGECPAGRAKALSVSSALPDATTDNFTLTLNNVPAPESAILWVTIGNVHGARLGGVRYAVRGLFLPHAPATTIGPGRPVCPLSR